MMERTIIRRTLLPVSANEALRWYARPDASSRLLPPWLPLHTPPAWPFHKLPVAAWNCRFEAEGPNTSWLIDEVRYRSHSLCPALRRIERILRYRHDTAAADLAMFERYGPSTPKTVGITGSTGLVGSSLAKLLATGGHNVIPLARPGQGPLPERLDALVHLAGEPIGAGRWTPKKMDRIRDSRVDGTRSLVQAIRQTAKPPSVLIAASAVGFYGHRRDEWLDEQAQPGNGFLAEVVQAWEKSALAAEACGTRVVLLRFGMILSPRGGALAKMLRPFAYGLGGRLGSGQQYWSWLSIDDALGTIYHALFKEQLAGPVNTVAPNAVTNAEFTSALGQVLQRPTLTTIPAWAARLALRQMADELLLASIRAVPRQLTATQYPFRHPEIHAALRHLLGRT